MKTVYSENILTINLNALAQNYKLILNHLKSDTECAVVVKSDAYGLGVVPIVKKLSSLGCSKFFVANLDEAIYLRTLSLTDEIYVLNGIGKNQEEYFFAHNIIPVINSYNQAENWRNYAKRKKKRLATIIHIDTGINRLGVSLDEAAKLFASDIVKDLKIIYLMSHLAFSENEDHMLNEQQYQQVIQFSKFAGKVPISFSNTGGVFLDKKYHFDLVRVGAAIYGLNVSPKLPPLHRVVSLISTVIQVREIKEEGYVGYGATAKVTPGMKLAVIPIGYADGMLHSSSNKGYCYIADVKTPIIGRVSMDSFVVDATNVPAKELYEGAEVEIIGPNCHAEHVAEYASTINYEVFLSLGHRYKRVYIDS